MSQKDYDTTLARMAGNIAAGIEGNSPLDYAPKFIATRAVGIAQAIIDICKEKERERDNANHA